MTPVTPVTIMKIIFSKVKLLEMVLRANIVSTNSNSVFKFLNYIHLLSVTFPPFDLNARILEPNECTKPFNK